jgi:competence protein ComEC
MVRLARPIWLALGAGGGAHAVVQLGVPAPAVVALAGTLLALAFALGAREERGSDIVVQMGGGMTVATSRDPLRSAPRRVLAAVAVGALLVAVRACATPTVVEQAPIGPEADWSARVVSVGGAVDGRQRAVLGLAPPSTGRVYARLPRYPVVAPGDTIAFSGRLEAAPHDEGFGAYLARMGVTATVEARAMTITRPSDDAIESLRRRAGDSLAAVLPEPEAGLAAGIMVGLRDRVAREVADDLTTAGLSHIVAISGWNIAVVAGLIAALLRGWPRRRRAVAMISAIAAYTVFAGASPSVVRAALMAAVVLLAREQGRSGRAAAALGMAAWLMLLADPATVSDAGFLLSVAATAGLLAWATPLTSWIRTRAPAWMPTWVVEALGVSLSAQGATLPIILVAFGRLSLVAPAANLMAAPFVLPAMIVGAVAVPVGWLTEAGVPDLIGIPVALAGRLTFGALVAIGRFAASLPFASITLEPQAAILMAAVASVGLALGITRRRWFRPAARTRPVAPHALPASGEPRPHRRIWLAALAVVIVGATLAASTRPDGRLRVTVLDVGQGDAILVQGDAGSRMLVDGGPDPDRLLVALDAQLPSWDRRIDLVVLTHPHEDHVAGLALLLERYRVATVAEVGMRGPGPGYAAFDEALDRLGLGRRRLAAGDVLRLDRATLQLLWPPRGSVPPEPPDAGTGINNVSAVLDVRFGARRLLLTGDVEEAIDPQLLSTGVADGGRLDMLKVAHHGSRTATTEAFLAALRPRVAVISAGTGNPYGHPTRQTLGRLAAIGARVYRTDLDGSVTIETDGHDLRAHATGGRSSAGSGSLAQAGEFAATSDGALASPDAPPDAETAVRWRTVDPATRYRCATPRIGPWTSWPPPRAPTAGAVARPAAPAGALGLDLARSRPTVPRPLQFVPRPPPGDERPDHQPGLLLGRGRLWHRARRSQHGSRPRRRGRPRVRDRRASEPRHLAGGCRGRDGRDGHRQGRAPPRAYR